MFEKVKKFLEDKRAEATAGGGGVVGTLVGIMVSLLIAIIVIMSLISSQTQKGWSKAANDTWLALQNNIWVAMTLLVIIPIIVGAVIILSYVRRGM
ncbi:MAG: hypothetical protein QXL57_02370 [Candidatus Bathyarchaeia archaeon]